MIALSFLFLKCPLCVCPGATQHKPEQQEHQAVDFVAGVVRLGEEGTVEVPIRSIFRFHSEDHVSITCWREFNIPRVWSTFRAAGSLSPPPPT